MDASQYRRPTPRGGKFVSKEPSEERTLDATDRDLYIRISGLKLYSNEIRGVHHLLACTRRERL
jgi:hypothetical protein